jgi:hypothetical protein
MPVTDPEDAEQRLPRVDKFVDGWRTKEPQASTTANRVNANGFIGAHLRPRTCNNLQ